MTLWGIIIPKYLRTSLKLKCSSPKILSNVICIWPRGFEAPKSFGKAEPNTLKLLHLHIEISPTSNSSISIPPQPSTSHFLPLRQSWIIHEHKPWWRARHLDGHGYTTPTITMDEQCPMTPECIGPGTSGMTQCLNVFGYVWSGDLTFSHDGARGGSSGRPRAMPEGIARLNAFSHGWLDLKIQCSAMDGAGGMAQWREWLKLTASDTKRGGSAWTQDVALATLLVATMRGGATSERTSMASQGEIFFWHLLIYEWT